MTTDDKNIEKNTSCDSQNQSQNNEENSNCDTNRRDFLGLVGAGCGVACLSYVGYKAVEYMAPSEDAKAESTTEVDISALQEGQMMTVKWRGAPIFISRRTKAEIEEAEKVDIKTLPDPEADSDRVSQKRKDILVVIGICTHLGCIPLGNKGDYDGWFCPCHGSHYDSSGRIRMGPAPKNLAIPPYHFLSETKILIGDGNMNDATIAFNTNKKTFLF
jgi:ubiquinol-cytochrome c reductase iron-sulfur subunit